VVGSRRMAVFDDMEATEKIRLYDKGICEPDASHPGPELGIKLRFGDVHIPWLQPTEPLLLECQHFVDCVLNGTTPRSDGWDGWDGLRVLGILEAADESLRHGGTPVFTVSGMSWSQAGASGGRGPSGSKPLDRPSLAVSTSGPGAGATAARG